MKPARQFGRWIFMGQSKRSKFYGFQWRKYDLTPTLDDPAAILEGWAVSLGIPFLVLSYRRY